MKPKPKPKNPCKAADFAKRMAPPIPEIIPELPEAPENNPVDIISPRVNNTDNSNTKIYIGLVLIGLALLVLSGIIIYQQNELSEKLSDLTTSRTIAPPLLTQNTIKDVSTEQPKPAAEPALPTA